VERLGGRIRPFPDVPLAEDNSRRAKSRFGKMTRRPRSIAGPWLTLFLKTTDRNLLFRPHPAGPNRPGATAVSTDVPHLPLRFCPGSIAFQPSWFIPHPSFGPSLPPLRPLDAELLLIKVAGRTSDKGGGRVARAGSERAAGRSVGKPQKAARCPRNGPALSEPARARASATARGRGVN
jgi:hypothetical protein